MLKIRNKKGQLAFMAVIIMVLILFFIFKANSEGYDFLMYMADEQGDLLANLPSNELAKEFLISSTQQLVYSGLYDLESAGKVEHTSSSCISDVSACKSKMDELFNSENETMSKYIYSYSMPNRDFEVSMPQYLFYTTCSGTGVTIEAIPYKAECVDYTPYPATTCDEVSEQSACESVKAYDPSTNSKTSGGCYWSESEGICMDAEYSEEPCYSETSATMSYNDCVESVNCEWFGCNDNTKSPDSHCEPLDEAECSSTSGCKWIEDYPAYITIISETNIFYQFNLQADGHYKTTISCGQYNKTYDAIAALAAQIQSEIAAEASE